MNIFSSEVCGRSWTGTGKEIVDGGLIVMNN